MSGKRPFSAQAPLPSRAAQRTRLTRGQAWVALCVLLLVAGFCALAGFYIGRNVFGGQYVKLGAARAKALPANAASQQSSEPAVVDEAPTDEADAEQEQTARPTLRSARVQRKARTAAAAQQTPAATGSVTLDLGSFLQERNAKSLVQDLRNRGYSPTLSAGSDSATKLSKVTMGPLSPEQGRALAAELRRQGYEVSVRGGGGNGRD